MRFLLSMLAVLNTACGNREAGHSQPGESRSEAISFEVTERLPGTLYSTFQSHLPTFARGSACTFKSYAVDKGRNKAREAPVEVRIACESDGAWQTVWSETGFSNPACLVEAQGKVLGVVVDWMTTVLKVVALSDDAVQVHTAADPFPTSSKINCVIFKDELIILGTYGYALTFSPRTGAFTTPRPVVAQNYQGTAYTQYPHLSLMGDALFLGYNTLETPTTFRFYDLVGYIVTDFEKAGLEQPLRRLLSPELLAMSTWVADTYGTSDKLYVATTTNDFNSSAEYAADLAKGHPNNLAAFGVCNLLLDCTFQMTTTPQDRARNFVLAGKEVLFVGGSLTAINIWRFDPANEKFELTLQVPHSIDCPYAWNFAPFMENGRIIGQVTETPARCNPLHEAVDETNASFRLNAD